jgi:hypothetical protein
MYQDKRFSIRALNIWDRTINKSLDQIEYLGRYLGYVNNLGDPEIRKLVLDVLKPHQPPLPQFASFLGDLECLSTVDISLVEMDERTESLKVILIGNKIDFDTLKNHMAEQGAVIHSVDQVLVEKSMKD